MRRKAAAPRAPRTPTDLGGRGWWAAARRAVREIKNDDLSDWAAALTYYAMLSIFPAMLVLTSVLGLIGRSATQPLIDNLGKAAPSEIRKILTGSLRNLQHHQGGAGVLALVALAGALWSASGYVAAFMRASNAIYDVPEGRPVWKTAPVRLLVTLGTMVLMTAAAFMVVVTGGIARRVGDMIGAGSSAVAAWDIAKWPVLLAVVFLAIAILYWASPNARQGFRWVTPGSLVAVLVWLIASGLFAMYVANFASYNKTYGTLAGAVIFLVWLYLSNMAVLLGAEFDAELERGRAIAAGHPAAQEPYVELRDQP
jgi:membrane protein